MNLDDITEQDAEKIRELLDNKFPRIDVCAECRYLEHRKCLVWHQYASIMRQQHPKRCPGFKPKPIKLPLLKRWFGREE